MLVFQTDREKKVNEKNLQKNFTTKEDSVLSEGGSIACRNVTVTAAQFSGVNGERLQRTRN